MIDQATGVTLPSVTAAERLFRGERDAWIDVLVSTAERAAMIGLGMWAFGERERLVKNSVAGAMAVEVFVLWRVRAQMKQLERSSG